MPKTPRCAHSFPNVFDAHRGEEGGHLVEQAREPSAALVAMSRAE
jgi:hypothetical protein